jgi:hypothetical protein
MTCAGRIAVVLMAVLALAACGAAPSPTPTVAVSCDPVEKAFDPNNLDLTGAWTGDDGGIYYIRQEGSSVWWNGMSGRAGSPSDLGRSWNNVARGVINALEINLDWVDVPRGGNLLGGTLQLRIEDDRAGYIVRIVKVSETGTTFGNSEWRACAPG